MTSRGSSTHTPAEPDAATRPDNPRWRAVVARDASADGSFFYSVSTTRVYCRPSCPSRQARRAHVRFHDTRADAEAAGFRACRRCRPDEPPTDARHARLVAAACRAIEAAARPPSLAALSRAAGLSPHHFHRLFRAVTGITPRAYAAADRASRLRHALETSTTVTEAIYAAGFESSRGFYAAAGDALGMTPQAYRAGGDGVTIVYGLGTCDLGVLLIAATERGLCALFLGDDADTLVDDLRGRFHRATIVAGGERFVDTLERAIAQVNTPGGTSGLPVDLHGTVFQRRVWRALQEIPAGATITYGALAARIDAPRSVRAVARACGANPVAVVVPCHRVVGKDGSLTGYRWGVARKRALLDRERT